MAEELALREMRLRRAAGDAVLQELERARQLDRQAKRLHRQRLDRFGRGAVAAMVVGGMVVRGRGVAVTVIGSGCRSGEEGKREESGCEGARPKVPSGHSGRPRSRISMRRFSAAFGSAAMRGWRSA